MRSLHGTGLLRGRACVPRPLVSLLFAAAGLFAACGASCQQVVDQYTQPAPRVLPVSPVMDDVFPAVNNNTAGIVSMYTRNAAISSPMFPTLRASIALVRPRQFRLKAETAITGPEVDLGSNEDLFWFWVRRSPQPALYFCRHDEFATSPARRFIPVEPGWLIEALGVTTLDPAAAHRGPYKVGAGRLEVRTARQGPQGMLTKITVLDDARGWVLEQHLYDEAGRRLASAVGSNHRRDALNNVTLPRQIELQWPPAQMSMTITLHDLELNTLGDNAAHLWTMPEYRGFQKVDLGR